MNITKPEIRQDFYFSRYIDKSNETDLFAGLEKAELFTLEMLKGLNLEKDNYVYAEGKWTIKQVLSHIIDTERILSYRALCISRKETAKLPGFDQDEYSAEEDLSNISLIELLEEYRAVRKSTVGLFKRMKPENLDFVGNGNGLAISARELGWVLVGHDIHHMEVIKERYL